MWAHLRTQHLLLAVLLQPLTESMERFPDSLTMLNLNLNPVTLEMLNLNLSPEILESDG